MQAPAPRRPRRPRRRGAAAKAAASTAPRSSAAGAPPRGRREAPDPADDAVRPRKVPAAERRRALGVLLDAWRSLARDLALAQRRRDPVDPRRRAARGAGGGRGRRARRAPSRPSSAACRGPASCSTPTSSPELVLDVLLVRWPPSGAAPRERRRPVSDPHAGRARSSASTRRSAAACRASATGSSRSARRCDLGLDGFVANEADGSVRVVAEGPRARLETLLDAPRGRAPRRRWSSASSPAGSRHAGLPAGFRIESRGTPRRLTPRCTRCVHADTIRD